MPNENNYKADISASLVGKTKEKLGLLKITIKDNLLLVIFSILYYVIVFVLAGYLNIWEDELYSLNTSSGTFSYAFHQAFTFEQQPPFYFLLLTAWRSVSASIIWARMFNMLLTILSQIIVFRFIKSITNKKLASWSAVILLLNPIILFTILEIRLYALVVLLSILITTQFLNTYQSNVIIPGKRIIFILLAVAGVFTQYYIGFLLLANAIVLLVGKRTKSFRTYIVDMIIPVALIILIIPTILLNAKMQVGIKPVYPRTAMNLLVETRDLISLMTFGNFLPSDFISSPILRWSFRGLILLILFISLKYKLMEKMWHDLMPFLIISIIGMAAFILVDFKFGKYFVEYKYLLAVFFPLFCLLAIIFNCLKTNFFIPWIIFLSVMYICIDFNKYHDLYKVDDYRKLGKYLEKNEKADEPIFVYRNITAELIDMYYNGINDVYPVPAPFSYNRGFNPELWALSENEIRDISLKLNKYKCFYVVILDGSLKGFEESKSMLTNYLSKNYKMENHIRFGRFSVLKFCNEI